MSAIDLKRLVFFILIFGLVSKNEKNGAKNNSSHSSEKKTTRKSITKVLKSKQHTDTKLNDGDGI